ncbi:hypothetical protein [Streptomyces yerevanensis]|uniref:hypothetical protein n=1 Tax=Streptomyces yerevanensis TaxID=66378 RepID=UPI00068CE8BF|nr:hypothetical protein [Streptomyces yerevanensis]
MADFRQQPDWLQPADRHTQLIDPVITVRQLSRFGFARKSLTRIDHALVFSTSKGEYDAYLPPVRPSRGEAAAKRYTAVYEVDMGVHPHQADIRLPSDNDAFEFTATVELSWQVDDPAAFVRSGHRDVPTLLLGELQQAARSLTRQFAIHESASAETELLRTLTAPHRAPLGATAGLKVIWTLRLRRDEQEIEHQRRLQSIDHASAEQIRTEQLGREYDAELDRRARHQDELQMGRAMEYGELEHELTLKRQEWQQEQDQLRVRHQTELQRLEAEKIAFYQKYLEEGGVVAWAMHLAANPEDSRLIINSMREDQLRLTQAKMETARELLSGDNAEDYELEAPKRLALDNLYEIFNQQLPGIPRGQSAPPPPTTLSSPSDVPLTKKSDDNPPASDPQPAHPSQEETTETTKAPTLTDQDPAPEASAGTFPGWRPPPGYGSSPVPTADAPAAEPKHNGIEQEGPNP